MRAVRKRAGIALAALLTVLVRLTLAPRSGRTAH